MTSSDTTAVNPKDDGSDKASKMDQQDTARPYHVADPKTAPAVSPGPDTREAPVSAK